MISKFFVGKPEIKVPLGRFKRQKSNDKIDHK
jgi:hypothetical protein